MNFNANDISGVPNYFGHMHDPAPNFRVPIQGNTTGASKAKKTGLSMFSQPPSSHSHYHPNDGNQRSQSVYVGGTSLVAIKFNGGAVLAADTLGSYGSLARYKGLQRIRQVNAQTMIGAGGEFSDFQAILDILDDYDVVDYEQQDGSSLYPKELFSLISRIQYNRRNKMDPLYNQLVIAGRRDGETFLGYSDLHGSNYEDNCIATGYGAYIGLPLLRNKYREDLTEEEAVAVVKDVMEVLFYRDKNTINKITIAIVKDSGVDIAAPIELETNWEDQEKPSNAAVQQKVYITEPKRKAK